MAREDAAVALLETLAQVLGAGQREPGQRGEKLHYMHSLAMHSLYVAYIYSL